VRVVLRKTYTVRQGESRHARVGCSFVS
jgi:hypothetical protein